MLTSSSRMAATSIVPVTARPSGVVLKYVCPGRRDVERAALQRGQPFGDELCAALDQARLFRAVRHRLARDLVVVASRRAGRGWRCRRNGTAPLARIQCRAALVSRPPENAMPTFSPTGRRWRMLVTGDRRRGTGRSEPWNLPWPRRPVRSGRPARCDSLKTRALAYAGTGEAIFKEKLEHIVDVGIALSIGGGGDPGGDHSQAPVGRPRTPNVDVPRSAPGSARGDDGGRPVGGGGRRLPPHASRAIAIPPAHRVARVVVLTSRHERRPWDPLKCAEAYVKPLQAGSRVFVGCGAAELDVEDG